MGGHYASIYIQLFICRALLAMGQIAKAYETACHVRGLVDAHFGRQADLVALVDTVMAEIRYEQGDLEEARALIIASFEGAHNEGWFEIVASACRTATLLTMDSSSQNATLLPRVSAGDFPRGDRARSTRFICAIEAHALVRSGRPLEAGSLLAIAEGGDDPLPDWRIMDTVQMARAEILIAEGLIEEANGLLDRYIERLLATGNRQMALYGLILQAHARRLAGRNDEATTCLIDALALAAPQSMVQAFVHGEAIVVPLLAQAKDRLPLDLVSFVGVVRSRFTKPDPESMPAVEPGGLSPREQEVLQLLAVGMSNKEMARTLSLAEGTVKVHRKRLYKKLKVTGRYAVLDTARRKGMLNNGYDLA
ncbi:LuxR family transcriptional regulator (plasmid) [Sphingomonas paeninsulae]|uniref:LuxR family transcriptional regulator n=1 Tax=Sphingomonas paeninsulae TaxID=2319844 RepID=A0A494TII2_SPHPE|nr:LuxR family transcriptional regulator [Sphingomonas paeninsulae]